MPAPGSRGNPGKEEKLTSIQMPPDCGPHCKVRAGGLNGITIRIVHCKRRKCAKCHNKPVKTG